MAKHLNVLIAVVVFLLQITLVTSGVSKRNVKTIPWPNCDAYASCKSAKAGGVLPNVVYVKASTDKHDIFHYVFSTYEIPTVSMTYTTGADVDLKFNWDILLNLNGSSIANAIFIQGEKFKVVNQMAVALTKLIEYNDISDDANLDDYVKQKPALQTWNIVDFSMLTWHQSFEISADLNKFSFSSRNYSVGNLSMDGNVTLAFRVPSKDGRDSLLPSLKFNANETVFDFILDHYTPVFKDSRFAVETVAISQSKSKKMSIDETSSIDDEYSPGVFRVVDWYLDPSHKSTGGFIQWKPVCYLNEGRSRDKATKVKNYELRTVDLHSDSRGLINNSLVYALFGEKISDKTVLIQATNVSFGLSKDGFYDGTNYTVWTGAIGYGFPPEDGISQTVIIIIACGLGLPVVIILFGGAFLIMRKLRKMSDGYSPVSSTINENSPQVN